MPKKKMAEREMVMRVGCTEQEAECWELAGSLARKFFQLPKLHLMDDHEVAQAIHVVQYKLLSRPAYRKYLELAQGNKDPDQGIVNTGTHE